MNSSSRATDLTLTETFQYSTSTHSYEIRWTSVGNPKSPPLVFYFHVYVFDNPGFGNSPLGELLSDRVNVITKEIALDADLAQQSAVFSALYKSWQASWPQEHRKAHVIAHDHGGLMALRANLLHGREYASLCLIDVVALGPFGQPLFKLVADNQSVFEALTGPVFEGVVESYIRDAAHRELSRETMEMLKGPWIADNVGRRGFVRQMVQANSRSTEEVEGRYHEIGRNMPVSIIWGKEDRWISVDTAERLKEKLNAQSVVLIEDAGHLVMYDQEGRF